jgi:hypothetical protein
MQLVRDYVVAQLIIDMRNILTCPPTSRQVVGAVQLLQFS